MPGNTGASVFQLSNSRPFMSSKDTGTEAGCQEGGKESGSQNEGIDFDMERPVTHDGHRLRFFSQPKLDAIGISYFSLLGFLGSCRGNPT